MKTTRKQTRGVLCFVIGVMLLCGMGQSALACEACSVTRQDVTVSSRFAELFFGRSRDERHTQDDAPTDDTVRYLCPGGEVFGVKIATDDVVICDVESADSCLRVGDRILSVDGVQVRAAADVMQAVRACDGTLSMTILRDGREHTLEVTPDGTDGNYRLGITLRDGTAGIGTVTFVDPETGIFGGLGHGICDAETGEILSMREGIVTEVTLGGVKKGESGKPGELHGVLRNTATGVLFKNCACGVFGRLHPLKSTKDAIPVATRDEVHEGDATILSTVHSGEPCAFAITIRDIDYQSDGTKSFTVEVTDPALIAMTGGIVRGMSGSPIIQDGKLIGAVTHVMVADPTEGYGIFIENMLNAAQMPMAKAS